jgi:AraC-like DNA-binding protein
VTVATAEHGQLHEAVARLAPRQGANECPWPRLTTYRFDAPQEPAFEQVQSLSLGVVVAGRKSVQIGDRTWHYDPMNYLVLTRDLDFTAHIVEAAADAPFYSLILQIEPALVRRVTADMAERTLTVLRRPIATGADPARPAFVSDFDAPVAGALLRFLQATGTENDRRVLAPLYLNEIVYRLLQADQRDRLLAVADQDEADPIATAARWMRANLARPLTVAEIADQVNMSSSAFAHLFKEVTGVSPYQFLQRARLDRARALLATRELNVSEVARAVGYGSLSHFSKEFRRRYGLAPRDWVADSRAAAAQ